MRVQLSNIKSDFKQDRQCTYNVTVRRVCATIVAVEKQWVLHNLSVCVCVCVCSLRCPACNARTPYCYVWPASIYNNFSHCLINGTIFEERLMNIKCVCLRFLQLLFETFLILGRNERDMVKNVYRCSREIPAIIVRFKCLNFLHRFSKNSPVPNFMKIRPVWDG